MSEEKKRIAATIYAVFEAGKNKELSLLEELHSNSGKFTKFDDFPPYTRQELQQAIIYEQAAFANISDFQYNKSYNGASKGSRQMEDNSRALQYNPRMAFKGKQGSEGRSLKPSYLS